jgi:sulfoxide reductase catalytic subunit YedY
MLNGSSQGFDPKSWRMRRPAIDPSRTSSPPFKAVTSYNNFYEFGTDKDDPARYAQSMTIDPWSVKVGGLVNQPWTATPRGFTDWV